MTITLTVEIGKSEVKNFSGLVREIYRIVLGVGRELLKTALEQLDDEVLAGRDTARYRCKGFQKTCIKTIMGAVEYKRRVYVDEAAVEGKHCVYLLDQELEMDKVGLVSEEVCQIAATAVCETTYRGAAELISETTGLAISAQGVWDIIQRLGESQVSLVQRHAELAQLHKGTGALVTKLLYEENDGVWLKLQGESRKKYGVSKEMKVGIAYDGVQWAETRSGKRRVLDNKVAYASFENVRDFRKNKEGLVASRFDVDEIELRVYNGDGAQWIRQQNSEECIDVLDSFHRNRKITECVRDPQFAALLRGLLYSKNIDLLLECLEAQINSVTDTAESEKLKELQNYYKENRDSLLGYYDRGIPIPETRVPGVIHHARLGSMESNVFTLIGNRMKGRRACWSEKGANNLAMLLCQRHTVGFEDLFATLPAKPESSSRITDPPVYNSSKIPKREGKGYEWRDCLHISDAPNWMRGFLKELISNHNL